MSETDLDARKARATAWFENLRNELHSAFERLEEEAPADLYPGAPGRFVRTPWTRPEGGGGVMGMMHGRLFEKVGVHVSTVHGEFGPEFARTMPGAPWQSWTWPWPRGLFFSLGGQFPSRSCQRSRFATTGSRSLASPGVVSTSWLTAKWGAVS